MTHKRSLPTTNTRQSLIGGRKTDSREPHRTSLERADEYIFQYSRETLVDLLNGICARTTTSMLAKLKGEAHGGTSEHELVKVEDRERVVSLLNNFVASVKQIQATLLLKPPLSSVPNTGGVKAIAGNVSRMLKDRCGEEIKEINQLLQTLTVRPSLYLEPEGRGLVVRTDAAANQEFSWDVANALLAVVQLIEREEMDTLRRCDCGKWYFASRSDQKSCSATCRQRRHASSPEFRATRRAYRKTVNEMKVAAAIRSLATKSRKR
jgi:hypothetical protein